MKKGLLIVLAMFICFIVKAGERQVKGEKCGTMTHMDYLKSKNSNLEQEIIRDENNLQQAISNLAVSRSSNVIYTIPVVVHIVYKTTGQNVSNAQVQSQIDVLNQDFGRTNPDAASTPAAFSSVASATNFQFCLAKTDPTGAATNGIERRQTTLSSFTLNDDMKSYSTGGLDTWDVNKYLNIWVCNLSGGIIGYGELPGATHTNTFGVVIQFDAFGRLGTAVAPYHLGRTCTHEISHCFRLYHIWGDDNGACSGTDYVNDTPNQGDATFGCYTFPHTDNCSMTSPGIMFMNYMDYSDDNCLNLFTTLQGTRMYAAINSYYNSLLTSKACDLPDAIKTVNYFDLSIYPNPTSGFITLDMFNTYNLGQQVKVTVADAIGKIVKEEVIVNPNGTLHQIDLRNCSNGVYFLSIYNDDYKRTEKITLAR